MDKSERGLIESQYLNQGYTIVGVDEVGRGCIAGDVYAGAVVLDYAKLDALSAKDKDLIRDSKQLSPLQRLKAKDLISQISISQAVASASVTEIFELGIVDAVMLAMRKALSKLSCSYSFLLIDGKQKLKGCTCQQLAVVKGDYLCYCIAAASIIAKVERDNYMHSLASSFPEYGFETHVGYGTRKHIESIRILGVTPIHRQNFEPISSILKS